MIFFPLKITYKPLARLTKRKKTKTQIISEMKKRPIISGPTDIERVIKGYHEQL